MGASTPPAELLAVLRGRSSCNRAVSAHLRPSDSGGSRRHLRVGPAAVAVAEGRPSTGVTARWVVVSSSSARCQTFLRFSLRLGWTRSLRLQLSGGVCHRLRVVACSFVWGLRLFQRSTVSGVQLLCRQRHTINRQRHNGKENVPGTS